MIYFWPALASFLIVLLLVPVSILLARRLNFYDHPNYRKIHHQDTPLLGGIPIYLAFLVTLFFFAKLPFWYFLIFLLGGTSIMILGLIDDYIAFRATLKFLLPLFSFLVLVSLGLQVAFLTTPLSFWLILLWILVLTNAINFIDNMNGLAAGVSAIAFGFLGILGILDSQPNIAVVAFALTGACLGFLPYNFPKARIFLGDAGSMFLGFSLAIIVLLGHWDVSRVIPSFFVPLVILGYPLFDFIFVTVRRIINRQVPWIGDKNHSSHALASLLSDKIGYRRLAVAIIYLTSVLLGLLGIYSRRFDFAGIAWMFASLAVFGLLVAMKLSAIKFTRPRPITKVS